jgi:hypothetical protein
VALQSQEEKWNSSAASIGFCVVRWNKVVYYGAKKLSASVRRSCVWYENHQDLVWQTFSAGECTQTVWRYASECFRKERRINSQCVTEKPQQIHPSCICTTHDKTSFVRIQSADYPETETGRQANATRLSYWHVASDRYGFQFPSKLPIFWAGYDPPVGKKLVGTTYAYVAWKTPHIHRQVVWDSPKVNIWCGLK